MELTGTYFGPDGTAIDYDEWSRLYALRAQDLALDSWWRRHTDIDADVNVSTVWLGLNHQFGNGPPLFWESMIFGGNHDEHVWRYGSRAEALDHHEQIVRALREGREP